MNKSPSDFVSTFLESVGGTQDVELYLRIFRQLPKESFAIVATEPALLRHATGVVAEALRFLFELDLTVTLALGLLGDSGPTAASVLKRLQQADVPCGPLALSQAVTGDGLRDHLTAVGSAVVDLRELPQEERARSLASMASKLGTRKLVLLRSRGGLGPHRSGRLPLSSGHALITRDSGISVVNLTTDFDALLQSKHLGRGEHELLRVIESLHRAAPALLTSVTSPFHLIQELFTVKGAGTLVKTGSTITRHDAFDALDVPRLVELVNETFGKSLRIALTTLSPARIYLEQHYRGVAVVQPGSGAAYLSKFAVSRLAQGEGLGRDLWEAVTSEHAALYWRADVRNPIVDWYARECDGLQRTKDWVVFWRGVSPERIPKLIEEAARRPSDFAAAPGKGGPT